MRRARVVIFLVLLGVASCSVAGGSAGAGGAKAATATPVIRIATEIGYAPYEVYAADGKTLEGLDVDLWTALAKELRVRFQIQDGTYAGIIPALESKRADIGWSAMALSSFVGLKQAKFLVYERRTFSGVVVAANAPIRSGTDLCGKSMGFTNGESPPISALQTECEKAGKPAVQIKRFNKTPDIILAVESGQVAARIADSVNGNYFVKQSGGKLKFVANVLPVHWIPTGIAVPLGREALLKELQTGLQKLIDNGTYGKIFARWGASGTEVKRISVAYKYAG
jgi:polar amino acid transport system substrate-binding protein